MIDRGIIKWQPFNSCFSGKQIVETVKKEKIKNELPILSEDQLKLIEESIYDAYHLNLKINLIYFWNGDIMNLSGKITNIFIQEKKICIENKFIYFKQILKITY